MSWYRTYRPKTIADLHLRSVREQMLHFLEQGKLPQVLLLSGPKGSGKTSTARILASIVNDPANAAQAKVLFLAHSKKKPLSEPNLKDELVKRIQAGTSYVVQELDAASNRGIDEVRRLKEEVMLPPQEGVIKVYILDEVHMFTTEAFNALLKLLEEPPEFAMFILATTEHHKIPATIVSRSTVVPFHKASSDELLNALQVIIDQEKIAAEPSALTVLAQAADGSFRDVVKMAENLVAQFGRLSLTEVEASLATNQAALSQLLELVLAKDTAGVVTFFQSAREQNTNPDIFTKQWLEFLHHQLLVSLQKPAEAAATTPVLVFLLKAQLHLPAREVGPVSFLSIEITLLDIIARSQKKAEGASSAGSSSGQKARPTPTATKAQAVKKKPDDAPLVATSEPDTVPTSFLMSDSLQSLTPGDSQKLFEQWQTFIDLVEKEHTGVAVLLRSAKPLTHGQDSATIAVYYPFHKQCLDEPKTRHILEQCLTDLTGGPIRLEFIVANQQDQVVSPSVTTMEPQDKVLLDLAQDILV